MSCIKLHFTFPFFVIGISVLLELTKHTFVLLLFEGHLYYFLQSKFTFATDNNQY